MKTTRTSHLGWRFTALFAVLACALVIPQAMAQNPTGDITGRVTDPDGAALPGVTVTATSPALQGERITVTGGSGGYKIALVPPGTYRLTYELDGFSTVVREVKVSAAQTTLSNVTLQLGAVEEEIVVTGRQATISETATGASTVVQEELDALPIDRDLDAAVNLVAGVNDTGPSSAPSIAGAMSFENLFLVNGVVINENVRGSILPLFIEDAIEETTTTITGVSAEYGRFTGGVVNAITKSGGNQFSGSFRTSFDNDDWESRTELSPEREDKINETFEATFGGYILKDHLWFFGAGRDRELSGNRTTDIPLFEFATTDEETRTEGKLTASPHKSHSIIGSYLEIDRTRSGTEFGTILDLNSVNQNREDPQEIISGNYTGILTPNLFLEAQYSERDFIIGKGSGGVPDLIEGTMFRSRQDPFRWHAPTFCGSCEDEQRNNDNLLGKASYFLNTDTSGSHDLVFGYDTFNDERFSINHQTGSDFTFYATDVLRNPDESIYVDPQGNIPPVIDPDGSPTPWVRWFAVFNLDLARPTAFETNSFFVNDRWVFNDRWSFNLGVRYDENDGVDSSGATVADDSKISPRLAASWDLRGTGDLVLNASYGTYVAAIANTVADDTSGGGAIGSFLWAYGGPPINTDPSCALTDSCTTPAEALQIIFDWYRSLGGVFDLDELNPNAAINDFLVSQSLPGATAAVDGTLESPSADEYTLGVTKQLGTKGLVRADLVYRTWTDFYAARTDLSTGQVITPNGPADFTLLGNFANDVLDRDYMGLLTSFRYRVNDRLTVAGNYTLSKTEGNFDGEFSNTGPVSSGILEYPEYKETRWNNPDGDLKTDQRHKIRAWALYDILRTSRHHLSVSWLENFSSGLPYSANETIDPRDFVTNPGYVSPDSSVLYYFTARDAFRTDDVHRSDVSLRYSFNVPWGRGLEIFIEPEMINVFDEDAVIDPRGFDNGESVRLLEDFDPFTETPVEGVHWERTSSFGEPANEFDFQTPRTYRFSVGLRF